MHGGSRLTSALGAAVLAVSALATPGADANPAAAALAADTVDEINCNFGDTSDSLWIHYRNPTASTSVNTVYYGRDTTYGQQVTAVKPAIVPVDKPSSSFREAKLTGLAPGQVVHYRIGATGLDHTCTTPPTGNFRWDDVGDTGTTLCTPWVRTTHNQIAADHPDFVTHGGDISYANECGQAAVHQYYIDQQAWSTSAAFQPVWGNHEYSAPTAGAPSGTPRDRLANYKGRSTITHAQTVPTDTPTRTSDPGCPALAGTTTNSCMGEDWGWFTVSGVLFISYPEPWPNALANWQTEANALMADAQADPGIDFIVTYGHRPAYSSSNATSGSVKAAVDTLGDRFGAGSVAGGKYVLNVAHHVHAEEAFAPMHGVVHLTNGGGGEGSHSLSGTAPGSRFTSAHPGYLTADYDVSARTLKVRLRCGPVYDPPNSEDPCALGSTLYGVDFTAGGSQPPPAPVELFTNRSVESSGAGFLGTYSPNDQVVWSTESAFDGTHSIRIRNTAAAAQVAGLANEPVTVTSTTAGATYTGSVWLRSSTSANRAVTLRLRECSSTGACSFGSATKSMTLTDTAWHQLTVPFQATRSGDQLRYNVYSANLPASVSVYADLFSLTKTSP